MQTQVLTILRTLLQLSLFIALAPLYDGLIRKVIARVQSRKGPPILQVYYDLFKLLGKENMDSAGTWPFRVAPCMALASILSVIAVLPMAGMETIFTSSVDLLSIIGLLTLGGVAVLMGGFSSRNTYGIIGASREMITMIMVEPILAMALMFGAAKSHSLDLVSAISNPAPLGLQFSVGVLFFIYLAALQAFVGRQPFDIAEAEVEILGGPFIEYSGPNYALFKLYLMIKQMFYAFVPISVFLPWLRSGNYFFDLVAQLLATALIFILIGLLGSTNPRFRMDQAIRYYGMMICISVGALGLYLYGF